MIKFTDSMGREWELVESKRLDAVRHLLPPEGAPAEARGEAGGESDQAARQARNEALRLALHGAGLRIGGAECR